MKGFTCFFVFCGLLLLVDTCLSQDYRIGEGDVLRISVYQQPDLEKIVRVSNEGRIVLPLIGTVAAKGETVAGISAKITRRLADGYLVNPHVSVYIQEFRSQKVTILGEVSQPGLYEISGKISFLELVSKAGGFTSLAGDEAVVKRQFSSDTARKEIIRIDLRNFMEKGDTSVDVALKEGDAVFVKQARMIYINGEVRNPNGFKYQQNMTVIKAITLANGFTEKAAPKEIKIIRKTDDREQVFKKVKMDMPVLPEDIIVVPESFF